MRFEFFFAGILFAAMSTLFPCKKSGQADVHVAVGFEFKIFDTFDTKGHHILAEDKTVTSGEFDKNDSTQMDSLMKGLKGIEFYFVFDLDQEKMAGNLRALMEFKQISTPEFLQTHEPEYRITTLDADGRMLMLECLGCETSKAMTYWDTEDGGVLMAIVSKGCGPICSYGIEFYKYKDNAKTKADAEILLPKVGLSDFLADPEGAEDIMAASAYELPIYLRKDGHDISISLWLEDEVDYADNLKGNLIPFTWNGMSFYRGEIINSKQ